MNSRLQEIGKQAQAAARFLNGVSTGKKNRALLAIADALVENAAHICEENAKDVVKAEKKGIKASLLDRLSLTPERVAQMADGIRKVADLPDPIGEVLGMEKRPNGLVVGKKRVPLGVIGVIYEARPNVTADTAALCLKSSNAIILRGGSEAICSNIAIATIMQQAVQNEGFPAGTISILEDTSRETAKELMTLNGYVDVLIPRGGAGLIQTVVQTATVPVIETGLGNCHAYVDADCDIDMAVNIIINAKTSRPSVCNALETVLIHKDAPEAFFKKLETALIDHHVEIRGCAETIKRMPSATLACEDDYKYEFLDYIIAVKIVNTMEEAILHIDKYGTKHSEVILTNSYQNANRFLDAVDAAAVYVNASTRFTDGYEFGFGAEIGISTQKMHARGPMGLKELTSYKYIIYGDGQIR